MIEKHKVFVDLDCLLDTRLAALGQYSEKAALNLLLSGMYHTRKHNAFDRFDPSIDREAVDALYRNRDIVTLRHSVITPITLMLSDLSDRYHRVVGENPKRHSVDVTVNVYPYKLDTEMLETIIDTVGTAIDTDDIRSCYRSLEDLDPGYLMKYDTVIRGELDEWINKHHVALATGVMKDTSYYCPEIYVNPDAELGDISPGKPANELRLLLIELLSVEIMPLELFSAIRPT